MRCNSRERQAAIQAKRNPKPWELERDDDLEEVEFPQPEPEEPTGTLQ